VLLQDEVPAALMDAHFKNVEASSTDGKFDPSAGLAQVCIDSQIFLLFFTVVWTPNSFFLEGQDFSLCQYVQTAIPLALTLSLTSRAPEIQRKLNAMLQNPPAYSLTAE
jgi:hypothetical protein